jgi:putative heme iron utilization protein
MNNAIEARRLLRAHRYGALSTLSKKLDGYPFGSITPYMVDHDSSLIIQISALAEHTKNIGQDARTSLVTHNQNSQDIRMQGRVTVAGDAQRLGKHHPRYLRHFPEAEFLATLDFYFYRITPVAIRYIGGAGRAHWINIETYTSPQAAEFMRHEERWLDQINTSQMGVVQQWLLEQHGINTGTVISLDCDGLDVRCEERIIRLDFADTDPQQYEQLSSLQRLLPS